MHLVLIGWLYVIGMMAITAPTLLRGLLLFVIGGALPVLAIVAFLGRRARTRRAGRAASNAKASSFEQAVNRRDDGDA